MENVNSKNILIGNMCMEMSIIFIINNHNYNNYLISILNMIISENKTCYLFGNLSINLLAINEKEPS